MSTALRWSVLAGVCVLFLAADSALMRSDTIPDRLRFSLFPRELAGYRSLEAPVENEALRKLQLTDYLSRVYIAPDGTQISVYVGYHGFQRQTSSIHSPIHCLPGSGWSILERRFVPLPGTEDGPKVNRLIVGRESQRRLVYYWYEGRGQVVAEETMALLYRLRDIALRDRSDAALVRFEIVGDDQKLERRMRAFMEAFLPHLPAFVPA